eukprot:CAMPEP_0172483970 /NCGR_PEP_ID=MMETSP1066-20121228/11219_1 /TAXON_ID=671091 /ORGANISM="Coscinodiscus wailesii, Strain CCMP2513" /LENGTH=32 /DNA_ID= /DNA_START= /DNA_END= /DNA_ORIENTATION=
MTKAMPLIAGEIGSVASFGLTKVEYDADCVAN